MTMRPTPVLPRTPGDRLRAEDWNEMQTKLEGAVAEHTHRIDADTIAPSAQVRARHLHSNTMRVDGKPLAEPVADAALNAGQGAMDRRLSVKGGEITGDLDIEGDLHIDGNLIVDGAMSVGGETVREERPLRRGAPRQLSASGEANSIPRSGGTRIHFVKLSFVVTELTLATVNLRGRISGFPAHMNTGYYVYGGSLDLHLDYRGPAAYNGWSLGRTLRAATWIQRGEGHSEGQNEACWYVYLNGHYNETRQLVPWTGTKSGMQVHDIRPFIYQKSPEQQTRTYLLDPGSWTFTVSATGVSNMGDENSTIRAEASMDIFLLPLPELAP